VADADRSLDLAALLAAMSPLEAVAVAFGLLYLVLAIRQSVWCWVAALISVLLSLVLFWQSRLYSESALQVFYAVMAVYGWQQWRRGGGGRAAESELPVGVWPLRAHVAAIGGTLAATAAVGWALSKTNAAFPYLDSFTSIGAVVTTYMVARKLLENWVYWLVIDGLSLYVYVARELYLYAALFVVYLVLVVLGFFRWRRDRLAQLAAVAP
jgi:nicotinamide mononucleotide transporter